MTKTITAYQARTNFGEIINQVYYRGEEIVVTKTGRPMVKIVKADQTTAPKENIWNAIRAIAKEGKRGNLQQFVRKDRDSGHSIRP